MDTGKGKMTRIEAIVAAAVLAVAMTMTIVAAAGNGQFPVAAQARIHQLEVNLLDAQIDNAKCRATIAGIQAQLDSTTLTSRRAELGADEVRIERDLVKELGGEDGDHINWATNPPSLIRDKDKDTK